MDAKRVWLAAMAVALLWQANPIAAAEAVGVGFQVSPTGNDAGDGSAAKPFATLGRARDAVRAVLAAGGRGRPVTVWLRAGYYELAAPLVFGPQDSGTPEVPVVYASWPGEQAVISGGRQIQGWEHQGENRWTVLLPEVRDGAWYPRQLFLGGERRTRARTPNAGFFRSDGLPRFAAADREAAMRQLGLGPDAKNLAPLAKLGFRYRTGDLEPWPDLADATLFSMHAWTGAVHWIARLDEDRRTVRFTGPSRFPSGHFEVQMPYYVENVATALDAPGEWIVDRASGVLTYLAKPGEDPRQEVAVVSRLKTLVTLAGDAEAGMFVEGLVFRDLSFAYADWGPLDRQQENDGLGSVHFLDAAVMATGTRHCAFEKCRISQCGGYGIYLIDGSSHNRIEQCELADLGGGGILIGCRWSPYDTFKRAVPPDNTPTEGLCAYNTVDNTFIHHGGRIFRGVFGVFVAHAPYNRITHNEICAMPYTGICVGRRLDRKYSHAHHNEIAYNHIHHLGDGVMSDMGGVYTEGVSPGTRVHHNYIHDVQRYRYGGWGLYCDQCSTGIRLDHNLVVRCQDGGFMQNVGGPNTLENNILALHRDRGMINSGRWGKGIPDQLVVERNIFWTNLGQMIGYYLDPTDDYRFDYNLYWYAPADRLEFAGKTWDEWRQSGEDAHSLLADPGFVDPQHDDFRLRPDSPAFALGFGPIDPAEAGLYGDPAWRNRPSALVFPEIVPLSLPPPVPVDEDFETLDVGDAAPYTTVFGETERSSVRVTEETAASGHHSLKFTDAAGLEKSYWPWLAYKPDLATGDVRLTFALRVGAGAEVQHEWRNKDQPYVVGPSLRIANGELRAGDQLIAPFPVDTWVYVEIRCRLSEDATGTYSLAVGIPGKAPVRAEELPCPGGTRFQSVNWLGFMGLADADAVFYLDDIRLKQVGEAGKE